MKVDISRYQAEYLEKYGLKNHNAVDVLLLDLTRDVPSLLMITREDTGDMALPGGMVDFGERFHAAAVRELEEETGLYIPNLEYFGFCDCPYRDPRGRIVSHQYFHVNKEDYFLRDRISAGDDAVKASLVKLYDINNTPDHAFYGDHLDIIKDFIRDYDTKMYNDNFASS